MPDKPAPGPAQVVVLLNGRPVTEYTFSAGVFKTACAPAPASPA
jgi:hypothetical protein